MELSKGSFNMWKFGSLGLKLLRMLHFLLIVLFLGGVEPFHRLNLPDSKRSQ